VLSIGRKFPRIFFVSIHEGLTGARGKSSPYLIAESIGCGRKISCRLQSRRPVGRSVIRRAAKYLL